MKKFLVVINAYPRDELIDAPSIRMHKVIRESGIESPEYVRVGRSLRMIVRCESLDALMEKVERIIPRFVDEVMEGYEVEIEELEDGEDSEGA